MNANRAKIGRRVIWLANQTVNLAVLSIVLLLLAFGCYALWDAEQVYQRADAAQYEIYKPREKEKGQSFGELQAVNKEVFAWLTVYGTHIDYPVAQGESNDKYVNTNAMGEFSLSGSIFLDSGNQKDFSDFNSILYGHHMEKKAMFGEIGLFSDQKYFQDRLYGNLYYNGQDHGLEFFAFLHVDAYDFSVFAPGVEGSKGQQFYLEGLLAKAKYTRDIGVTAADRIVLLSTCSTRTTNGRDILVARLTNERYPDSFKTAASDRQRPGSGADKQSRFARLPGWMGGVLLILLLLVLLLAVLRKRRRRSWQDGDEGKYNCHDKEE